MPKIAHPSSSIASARVYDLHSSSTPFKQLTRLTVVLENAAQIQSVNPAVVAALNTYDLIAVQPVDEKMFEHTCRTLEVDIITFDFSRRIPFPMKFPPVNMALERGLYFEITYAASISDVGSRAQFLNNAMNLLRLTKGRNVIVSSGAKKAMELRGPYDVANLCSLFGLNVDVAKNALSSSCRSVILHGETRARTVKGVLSMAPLSALPAAAKLPPIAKQQSQKKQEGKKKERSATELSGGVETMKLSAAPIPAPASSKGTTAPQQPQPQQHQPKPTKAEKRKGNAQAVQQPPPKKPSGDDANPPQTQS